VKRIMRFPSHGIFDTHQYQQRGQTCLQANVTQRYVVVVVVVV